jgi:hypothetical protein
MNLSQLLKFIKDLFIPATQTDKNLELANLISNQVSAQTNKSINDFKTELKLELKEMNNKIKRIETNIDLLEKSLQIKEMSDKRNYAHMQYKLNEVPNNRIQKEIQEIRSKLKPIN